MQPQQVEFACPNCDAYLFECLNDELWLQITMVTLIKRSENRCHSQSMLSLKPLLHFREQVSNICNLSVVVKGSCFADVLEGAVLFIVDYNSLLLALEDLIVLLKLSNSLHNLFISHLATDIAANLSFLLECI